MLLRQIIRNLFSYKVELSTSKIIPNNLDPSFKMDLDFFFFFFLGGGGGGGGLGEKKRNFVAQ